MVHHLHRTTLPPHHLIHLPSILVLFLNLILSLSLSPSSTTPCTNHTQSRIPSLFINHTLNHILILTQSQNTISLSTSLILSQSLSLCITSHTLSHHRYIIHLSKSLSLCITCPTLSHHRHTIRLIQSQDP